MYRMVYMSRATHDMSDAELQQILATAQINNAQNDVTGILLYVGDTFFQVLEGPKFAVETTFERVFDDARHQRVRQMYARNVEERRFSDWSMGYRRLDVSDDDASAFFELSQAEFENRIPRTAGEDLLKLMHGFSDVKLAAEHA